MHDDIIEFLDMLLESINGGGRIVTFMDQDIVTLEDILEDLKRNKEAINAKEKEKEKD